jgi:PAS domain S-box-containing protein
LKWSVIVAAVLASVWVADMFTPAGLAIGVLYVVAILAATASRDRRLVIAAAVASTGLILVAWFFLREASPPVPQPIVLANRLMSLIAVLVASGLALYILSWVTRVEQVSEELRGTERLMSMARQLVRFGAWSFDVRTQLLHWTPEVFDIHEVSGDREPSLDEAIEYYDPEYKESVTEAVRRCLTDGIPFDEEWVLTTAKGRALWVRAVGEAIRDEHGEVVELFGAIQDIDARKRAEASLEASEQRFQEVADSMPLGIWSATADGRVDYQNRYVVELSGVGHDHLNKDGGWLDIVHPDDRDGCIEAWTNALSTGVGYRTTFRVLSRDGCARWHLVEAEPSTDDEGRIVRWHGTAIDIDDQIRLTERYQSTLESMTDAYFSADRNWMILYVNAEFERLLGRKRESLIGTYVWEQFPHADEFRGHYERALRTGTAVHFQARYAPVDLWFDVHAYPSAEGIGVYFRDITAERAAEEQLRQSQRLESVGQLTGGIAHDFNNLLTVIIGNAETLSERLAGDRALHPLAETIASAALRGSRLTQRLLAFARRQTLDPRPADLNKLLADMEPLLARTLGEDVEIKLTRAAGLWTAMVDTAQLENALLNLCINARDAMPDGGRLTIETANTRIGDDDADSQGDLKPGQYVMLAVSDSGTGIEPEHLARVFDPFFTTKEHGKGTGLGLAMVYGFVKQSGGHAKIYSEPGEGTIVKLFLPRTRSAVQHEPVSGDEFAGGGETVLLVEDDDLVRNHARDQLIRLGYRVIEASNGADALDILRQGGPLDLLFTDVVMPGGIGGGELAQRAREMKPGLKVLYTSGYTENSIVNRGRLDPGVKLLSKPYRLADLARQVRRAIDD